jgi:hypothetical protein
MGIVVEKRFHVMPRVRTRYQRCYELAGMGIIEPGSTLLALAGNRAAAADAAQRRPQLRR